MCFRRILFFATIAVVRALFNATTVNTTWSGNSVQPKPNDASTFCYYPAANRTNATFCTGSGRSLDPTFQPILTQHLQLKEGFSIAYYSGNNALLGNHTYPVRADTGMRLCLSGKAGDGYQTMCMAIDYDNNIVQPGSYCAVALGQSYVSDGCYNAMTDDPTARKIEIVVPIVVCIVVVIVVALLGYRFRKRLSVCCGRVQKQEYLPLQLGR